MQNTSEKAPEKIQSNICRSGQADVAAQPGNLQTFLSISMPN